MAVLVGRNVVLPSQPDSHNPGALDQVLSHDQPNTAAILFIDLDGFKTINDTLGHAAGDDLLAGAAHAIAAQARAEDVVGRVGGDEFVMICRGLSRPPDALAVAARLQEALAHTVAVPGGSVEVSASIGVTMVVPGATLQALLSRADEAMYRSKRQPDRTPVFLPTAGDPELGRAGSRSCG